MKCPNCGVVNPDDTVKCSCGYNFTTHGFNASYSDISFKRLFFKSCQVLRGNWTTVLALVAISTVVSSGLTALGPKADQIKWLVGALTTIPLMVAADRATEGRAIDVWESYDLSLGFFWRYIWTSILYLLVVSCISLLIIPLMILQIFYRFRWPFLWHFLVFSIFLAGIGGIILALRYFFAPFAVVIEGISGRAALSRSKSLTKGRMLSTLRYQVGFGILFFLLVFIPLGLLIALSGLLFVGDPLIGFQEPNPVWAKIVWFFGSIICGGTFEIFNVLLFKSLRAAEISKKSTAKALEKTNAAADLESLAELYKSQGKYAEAERLRKQAREIRNEVLALNSSGRQPGSN